MTAWLQRSECAARERNSLADALLELAGPDPQSAEELHTVATEEWGSCTLAQVAALLCELRHAGCVRREGSGYVAAGDDR
jgi:hypothetical protein